MRVVLDFDLDFFVLAVTRSPPGGGRLTDKDFSKGAAEEVREFLDHSCHLTADTPNRATQLVTITMPCSL
jgi:hypothetical protein